MLSVGSAKSAEGTGGERLLLTGAVVHTVSGATFSPGSVLIDGDKIISVGDDVEGGDAKVIDLTGLHLFPGLIAPASSLGLSEINAVRASIDTTEVGGYTPDVAAWLAVNPDSELIPVARANGITHALVLPLGGTVSGQSGVIQLAGWTTEDMVISPSVALHVFWPDMDLNLTPKEQFSDASKWKSIDDQVEERLKKLHELDEFFHEAEAYVKAREASSGTNDWMITPAWEALIPYISGSKPIMVHANESRQIRAALEWAAKRKYKIILAGGRDAWKLADLLAKQKVPVVYDQVYRLPDGFVETYDASFSAPAILNKAGVKVAISEGIGASASTSLRNLPYAAAQAAAFGLPRDKALQSITLIPAEILGLGHQLGSIEPGKEASLVATTGDILDIRSVVTRVWIAGKEVSLESRHTRLYDKYRQRPRPAAAD